MDCYYTTSEYLYRQREQLDQRKYWNGDIRKSWALRCNAQLRTEGTAEGSRGMPVSIERILGRVFHETELDRVFERMLADNPMYAREKSA